MNDSSFHTILRQIESEVATYYGFTIAHSVADHLLPESSVAILAGVSPCEALPRAAVYFSDAGDVLDIGLHIASHIQHHITRNDPAVRLSNENVDSFCAIVEEVSHFHLLINRKMAGTTVSLLELEWQAEVDKVLFSAIYLRRHFGDPHIQALLRLHFGQGGVITAQASHYVEASRFAARFWLDFVSTWGSYKNCLETNEVRALMRRNYEAPMNRKIFPSNGHSILKVA